MKKTGSIRDLRGCIPYGGPPISDKEINEAIGRWLALDDLRIRRQWRTLAPKRPEHGPSPADQLLLRAHKQWGSGKHRSAFRLILSAARLGDPGAIMGLGYYYDMGIGVKKNRIAAIKWYKKADRRGNTSATSNIGVIYRFEGNAKRALYWFGKAAARGDISASFEIARESALKIWIIQRQRYRF